MKSLDFTIELLLLWTYGFYLGNFEKFVDFLKDVCDLEQRMGKNLVKVFSFI